MLTSWKDRIAKFDDREVREQLKNRYKKVETK